MILTRKKIFAFLALPIWCFVYAISVNRILSEWYLAGTVEVVPYYKCFSPLKFVLCLVLVELLFYITLRLKAENIFVEYVKNLLFLLFVVPAIIGYSLFDQIYYFEFLLYCVLYWLVFCLLCHLLSKCKISFKRLPISCLNVNKRVERVSVSIISIALVAFAVRQLGGIRISLSLSEVYSTRAEFKENGSMLLTIIKSALGCYICPCMIVKYLREKRTIYAAVFIALQIVVFSMAKDKAYLLLFGLAIAIGLFGGNILNGDRKWLSFGMYGLAGINTLANFNIMQNFIFNIFTRRFFTMPAWLQYINFEMFYDKPKIWWQQDTFLIDKLFTPVYSRSLVEIVANDYFHGWIGNPNNGMAGEAFTRCGYLGIIIYPCLLVALLYVLAYIYRNIRKEVLFIFAFAFSMTLSNDVITSTSFVMVLLIIVAFSYVLHKPLTRSVEQLPIIDGVRAGKL